jgi:transposase
LTEARGIPLGLAVAGANRHDMKLARATLESIVVKRPAPTQAAPQGLCLDKAYDSDEIREMAETFGFTTHIRARGEEAHAIQKEVGYRARRWVVERTHSWMNRFRRVLVRWEKRADTYLAMLHFAMAIITWHSTDLVR